MTFNPEYGRSLSDREIWLQKTEQPLRRTSCLQVPVRIAVGLFKSIQGIFVKSESQIIAIAAKQSSC